MVFVLNQLAPVGNTSRPRKSIPQGTPNAGAPAVWTYFHASDNLAAIKASGYFNDAANLLSDGDVIIFSANGAAVDIVTIADITSAGVVTSQTADINSA